MVECFHSTMSQFYIQPKAGGQSRASDGNSLALRYEVQAAEILSRFPVYLLEPFLLLFRATFFGCLFSRAFTHRLNHCTRLHNCQILWLKPSQIKNKYF